MRAGGAGAGRAPLPRPDLRGYRLKPEKGPKWVETRVDRGWIEGLAACLASTEDWYRPPEANIPSWISQESQISNRAPNPDPLAAVVASLEWPSWGGFTWSVCLPTSNSSR